MEQIESYGSMLPGLTAAKKGCQVTSVLLTYNGATVSDERITGYDMTELESGIIDVIKARYDDSIESCFDYQQEQLRQKRIDNAVDGYLTPDNNKSRYHHHADYEPSYFNATDIACMVLSVIMVIVLTVGYLMI